jgi:putative glutamine amidotransferase
VLPPVIGLTLGRSTNQNGFPIFMIMEAYIHALQRNGACPVMVPPGLTEQDFAALMPRLDGLLFTGGGDVHPKYYGGKNHPLLDGVDQERDQLEVSLAQSAIDLRIPFLGICRGLQVINVALGGTIYEDILDQLPGALQHSNYPAYPRSYPAHPISIQQGSQLESILGARQARVNSLHHQGIKELSPHLVATAFAPDGIVEAFEYSDHPFGIGVQWHPEWLKDETSMDPLFQAFIRAAQDRKHG